MLKLYIDQDPAACEVRRGLMLPTSSTRLHKYLATPCSSLMFGASLVLLKRYPAYLDGQ